MKYAPRAICILSESEPYAGGCAWCREWSVCTTFGGKTGTGPNTQEGTYRAMWSVSLCRRCAKRPRDRIRMALARMEAAIELGVGRKKVAA